MAKFKLSLVKIQGDPAASLGQQLTSETEFTFLFQRKAKRSSNQKFLAEKNHLDFIFFLIESFWTQRTVLFVHRCAFLLQSVSRTVQHVKSLMYHTKSKSQNSSKKTKVKTVNMKKSFPYDLQEQQQGIMMIFWKKKNQFVLNKVSDT